MKTPYRIITVILFLLLGVIYVSYFQPEVNSVDDFVETTEGDNESQAINEGNGVSNSSTTLSSENELNNGSSFPELETRDTSDNLPIRTNARREPSDEWPYMAIAITLDQYESLRLTFHSNYNGESDTVCVPDYWNSPKELTPEYWVDFQLKLLTDNRTFVPTVMVQPTLFALQKNFDFDTYNRLLDLAGKAYNGEYTNDDPEFRTLLETYLTEDETDEYQMLLYENEIGMSAEYWFNKMIEGEKDYDSFKLLQGAYWGLTRTRKEDCIAILPRVIPLFESDNELARWWSVTIPGIIGPEAEEAIPALRDRLSDEYGNVRREAATSLGKIGKSSWIVMDDIAALLNDSSGEVRREAILALANIGELSVIHYDKIVTLLRDDNLSKYGQLIFVTMYGKQAPAEVQESLVSIMVDPGFRRGNSDCMAELAIVALAGIPDITEESISALGRLLVEDPFESGRELFFDLKVAAAYALSKMGAMAEPAIDALISELFNLNVAELYVDYEDAYTPVGKWFTVSELCAEALGNIGGAARRAIPHLERLAQIDGNRYGLSEAQVERVQTAAREAIQKIAGG
ncbi:MAG: HEAT repeat domain-containing protein [Planctomycetes bacterium]|nr:HEAT repeat domain-containing protein [Planctomycetota bacterium]